MLVDKISINPKLCKGNLKIEMTSLEVKSVDRSVGTCGWSGKEKGYDKMRFWKLREYKGNKRALGIDKVFARK